MSDDTTTRGPMARYYKHKDGTKSRRVSGVDEPIVLNPDTVEDLAFEHYIVLRRSHSHEDIVSGKALPDRTPPAAKAPKTPNAAKASKNEMWRRAIAEARARQSNGTDVDTMEWACGLTSEQVAVLKKDAAVRVAYRELSGTAPSLVEIAATATSLDEAA